MVEIENYRKFMLVGIKITDTFVERNGRHLVDCYHAISAELHIVIENFFYRFSSNKITTK